MIRDKDAQLLQRYADQQPFIFTRGMGSQLRKMADAELVSYAGGYSVVVTDEGLRRLAEWTAAQPARIAARERAAVEMLVRHQDGLCGCKLPFYAPCNRSMLPEGTS